MVAKSRQRRDLFNLELALKKIGKITHRQLAIVINTPELQFDVRFNKVSLSPDKAMFMSCECNRFADIALQPNSTVFAPYIKSADLLIAAVTMSPQILATCRLIARHTISPEFTE